MTQEQRIAQKVVREYVKNNPGFETDIGREDLENLVLNGLQRYNPRIPVFYYIRVWSGDYEFSLPHTSPSREAADQYVATFYDEAREESDGLYTNGEIAWRAEHMEEISKEEYHKLSKRIPGSYV